MEGFFAALQYLEDHPGVDALLGVTTLFGLIGLYFAGKRGRGKLHAKIERNRDDLHEDLQNLRNEFHEHVASDARELGGIGSALKFIAQRVNGGEPMPDFTPDRG